MRRLALLTMLLVGCGQVQRDSIPGGSLPTDFTVKSLQTGSSPLFVTAADLNGDGLDELIASDRTNNKLQVLSSGALSEITLSNSPGQCAVGDFVGDSRPDLAVALRNGASVLIFDHADSSSSSSIPVGTSPQGLAVRDLDGDGRSDLIVSNVGSNSLSVLWGQAGGGLTSPIQLVCGGSPVQVLIQDVTGDGRADLVTSNFGSGSLTCYVNQGSRSFTLGQTLAVGNGPFGLAGGDLNGDGKPDLVVANEQDNTLTRWLLGDSGLGQPLTLPVGLKPDCLLAADVNRDQVLDLLVTLEDEGGVAVLLGDGLGGFQRTSLIPTQGGPVDIQRANLDGSGQFQAVTANFFGQGLSLIGLIRPTIPESGLPRLTTRPLGL
ncbi:VCBS repeat-containing protein [bacterium]|nr:VCBS repeat-containing protein [bacterium]